MGMFGALAVACAGLAIIAWIFFEQFAEHSSFWPLLSLASSDPDTIIRHTGMYAASVGESVPGFMLALLLVAIACLLLAARLVSGTVERFFTIKKNHLTCI